MLVINSNQNKQKLGFGTSLSIDKSVVDNLKENPQDLKQIQEFKKYLEQDGKNWKAKLTYDKFEPSISSEAPEIQIKKLLKDYSDNYNYDKILMARKTISKLEPVNAVQVIEGIVNDKSLDNYDKSHAVSLVPYISDNKSAVNLLEKFIQNPDDRIKEEATSSIFDLKDKTIQKQLMDKYFDNDNITIKRSIARNIYKQHDDALFSTYIDKIYNDPDSEIKSYSLYTIADSNDEVYQKNAAKYDSMIEECANSKEKALREASAFLLGRISDEKKAVELIYKMLDSDISPWRKYSVSESVKYIKNPETAKNVIINLLEHPESEVRFGVITPIMNFKDEKIQNELLDRLMVKPSFEQKRRMAFLVDNINDKDKQSEIFNILINDPEDEIREHVIEYSCLTDNIVKNNEVLNKYIKTDDYSIKKGLLSALDSISKDNPEYAEKFLQVLANDKNKFIQNRAKENLDSLNKNRQMDGYGLKITNESETIGKKKIEDRENLFNELFKAYKVIFQNYAIK